MAFSIKCPHCGKVHKVGPEVSGKRVTCGSCKESFLAPRIPAAGGAASRPWSLHVDGRNVGPYSADEVVEQIKSAQADGSTLAWKDGMDDWAPLADIAHFREALSAGTAKPPPVGHRTPAAGRRADDHADPAERRHHYVRGRGKRDIVIGAWVAGVMAIGVLIAVLALRGKTPEGKHAVDPRRARAAAEIARERELRNKGIEPKTPGAPTSPKPGTPMPRKRRPPSHEKLLGKIDKDLKKRFKAAIDGHKQGKARHIRRLISQLNRHVESLGKLKWDGHQARIDRLVSRLSQAAEGIKTELDERAVTWIDSDGVDAKTRAEALRLNEYQWLSRWETIMLSELDELRERGLKF